MLDIDGPITLGADGSGSGDKVRSVLQGGEKRVLLNVGAVAYIDSAGLGELVNAFTTVKKQGGALILFGVTKKLKDLLVITKLATVFDSSGSRGGGARKLRSVGMLNLVVVDAAGRRSVSVPSSKSRWAAVQTHSCN